MEYSSAYLFLESLEWNSKPHELCQERRLIEECVSVIFTKQAFGVPMIIGRDVYLETLESRIRGSGHGSKAMQLITELADDTQTSIWLHAMPLEDYPTYMVDVAVKRLKKFYGQFNFKEISGNLLNRPCRPL